MTDNNAGGTCWFLDELYPAELFQLLVPAAKADGGLSLGHLEMLIPADSLFTPLVTLKVPQPGHLPTKGPGAQSPGYPGAVEKLLAGFREIRDNAAPGHKPPGGTPLPLAEGLCRLLLLPQRADGSPPPVKGDEYLVVGRDMNKTGAAALFKQLSIHATHTRVAAADTAAGNRYLYYIKDDHHRQSSFLSLAAGDGLGDALCLKAFQGGEHTLFLPMEVFPGAPLLEGFTRLMMAAPRLWGGREVTSGKGLLAAVCRWPGKEDGTFEIECLMLDRLRFYDQSAFTRPDSRYVTFSVVDIKEGAKSEDELKRELREEAPGVGYRLELKSMRHLDNGKGERLYEEKARIEYQLAYLESIRRPRPMLYRFTQKQLQALADIIRSFPLKVLHDGGLKYGFQATDREPAGFHFILSESGEGLMNALDPLPLWEDLDTPPMRFILDPFWARYYHDRSGSALVFVPEGTALFPPMHDWDRLSMDRYLRETLEQWFIGDPAVRDIPADPLYLFDGRPVAGDVIRVSVMDLNGFVPLHLRIGWLNDNLVVTRALGAENLITRLAKDITWQDLFKKITADAEAVRREFEEAAGEVGSYIAETIHELTEVLTEEINRVVERTLGMVEEVKDMDSQLGQWENISHGMKELLEEVREKQDMVLQQTVGVKNEFFTMARQMDYEITHSERSRVEIEGRVLGEIERLRVAYRGLRDRLRSFKP